VNQFSKFEFDGIGIVFRGYVECPDKEFVARIEMAIDDLTLESAFLPVASSVAHRNDLFWKYKLKKGKHVVKFKWINSRNDAIIHFSDAIVYSNGLNLITKN